MSRDRCIRPDCTCTPLTRMCRRVTPDSLRESTRYCRQIHERLNVTTANVAGSRSSSSEVITINLTNVHTNK